MIINKTKISIIILVIVLLFFVLKNKEHVIDYSHYHKNLMKEPSHDNLL
jgi:hypothetical protein